MEPTELVHQMVMASRPTKPPSRAWRSWPVGILDRCLLTTGPSRISCRMTGGLR